MRAYGENLRGHGTAPGGYPAWYVEDDTGKHWAEPEDLAFERADSPTSEPCGPGVVPAWAPEYDFTFPWEKKR